MIHPKICKEPSLRERYKGYKQYEIYHDNKSYIFTVNAKNKIIICHSQFNKSFKNRDVNKLIDYCKSKGKECILIADEENELWNL